MAAALGETRKNKMRPIERERHWFLTRERMAEGQRLVKRPFPNVGRQRACRGACILLRAGKHAEKWTGHAEDGDAFKT